MSDSSHFNGKLVLRDLPCLTPGSAPEMPTLKRLMLLQGELAQIHDSDLPIHYIAALELKDGGVRGNHFHRIKVEHTYVVRGALELIVCDPETGEQLSLAMREGSLVLIQPGIAHAYRTVRPGIAFEFAPTSFDSADIHKYPLA